MSKFDKAVELVAKGATSATEIQTALRKEFESVLPPILLSGIMAGCTTRDEIDAYRAQRDEFIRARVRDGLTDYQVCQASKAKFGGYCPNFVKIRRIRDEEKSGGSKTVKEALSVLAVPQPMAVTNPANGATEHIAGLLKWMHANGGESFTITADGKVHMVVRHEFEVELS